MVLESLFIILFVVFVCTSLLSMVLNSLVVRRLRRHHWTLWESMGGTTLFSAHKLDVFVRVLKLCYGPQLIALRDETLIWIGLVRNLLEVFSICLFIYLVWFGIQLDKGGPIFM